MLRTFSCFVGSFAAFVALGLTLSGPIAAQTLQYNILELGRLGGTDDSIDTSDGYALNNRGQVIGLTSTDNGDQTGFLWSADAGMIDLGFRFNGPDDAKQAINDYGQIVSGTVTADGNFHAVVWQPTTPNAATGNTVPLPDLGTASLATGINNYGQIIGRGIAFNTHALLWTPTTPNGTQFTLTDLSALPGGIFFVSGINSQGQVVGLRTDTLGNERAFLWTPTVANGTDGTITDLDLLPGYTWSSYYFSINDTGRVVGTITDAFGSERVFLWSPATPNGTTGTMTVLGSLGGTQSEAYGINSSGQIVGLCSTPDGSIVGCLWLNGIATNPATLIPGGTPTGFVNDTRAINNGGQITGLQFRFYDANGFILNRMNAFLMTPITTTIATGADVSVTPSSATTLTFDNVTQAGNTTVTTNTGDPGLPPNFQLAGTTAFFDIQTTATFSGQVELCVNYDPTQFTDPNNARLLHYVNGAWVDITTFVNTTSHIVCGKTSSFSPFAVAGKKSVSWSGVLAPVNSDGSSVFKLGSTVPVKFTLTGADAGKTNLAARLYLAQVNTADPTAVNEAVSTAAADSGNTFRYDGQYIFNLSTKSLSKGTWYLRIDLGDGTNNIVPIKLK